ALARGSDADVIAIAQRAESIALKPIDRARLSVAGGRARQGSGEVDRAVSALSAAVASASSAGDTVLEGRAHAHLADALARLERFEEAERALGLSLALAARSAHVELRFVSLAAM